MEFMSDLRSEEPIFKYTHIAMLVLLALLVGLVSISNPGPIPSLRFGYAVFFLLTLIRHFLLPVTKSHFLQGIFPYLEGLIVYLTVFFDGNTAGLSILTLLVWDIALDYRYTYGAVYAFSGYLAYMSIYIRPYVELPPLTIFLFFAIAAFQILLYVGFAFLAKSYSVQSRRLKQTTADLQSKMITAEEMTTLKERNRIAMEIHNTVGHQLTTALVQIEAALMVYDQDPGESKRRMQISKEQVQLGLNQLRDAIHTIKADRDYEDFSRAVEDLLNQVRVTTPVSVDAEFQDISDVRLPMKRTFFHMILECITNAIRHGHSRSISIRLIRHSGIIVLTCHNDGQLPKDFHYGFGLKKIEEQIAELGGTFSARINPDGWFGFEARVPVVSPKGDAHE